jgi:phosphoglycolate phosphatase-like HAD superfamily hydrolase
MLETIRPGTPAPGAQAALFDFDGTLSLIRSGWLEIMLDMMVKGLAELGAGENEEQLRAEALELVWPHTGRDTRFQMEAFAGAVRARGGAALDPLVYKQRFLDSLFQVSEQRTADLREGRCPPDRYLVPGTRPFLEELRDRGVRLYLASGTDHDRLQDEAALLDIARYFDGGIFGALPDPEAFSKGMLVALITSEPGMHGGLLVGFGDGPTETIEVHRAGGIAVGLATDEPECRATSPFKRRSLIESGADYIIPNYLCRRALLPVLFAEHEPI